MKNFKIKWSDFPDPCYDPQEKYGKCPPTFLDLMRDERIPAKDRFWAFCACGKVNEKTKRLFAVRAVRETPLPSGGFVVDLLTDPRSIAALDVAERHANGNTTDKELAAAMDAAWDAAMDAAMAAAGAAAWAAAWAAARAAARDAAMDAAWDAAWAAARDAAWDAAWAAAGDAQLNIILSMIEQ